MSEHHHSFKKGNISWNKPPFVSSVNQASSQRQSEETGEKAGGDKPVLETIKILKRKESSSFRSALRMLGDWVLCHYERFFMTVDTNCCGIEAPFHLTAFCRFLRTFMSGCVVPWVDRRPRVKWSLITTLTSKCRMYKDSPAHLD